MFGFPYSPYESQKYLMSEIYEGLNNRDRMIVESPTGTGKSLCLLCSTITWLFNRIDSRKKTVEDLERAKSELSKDDQNSDWITSFATKRIRLMENDEERIQIIKAMEYEQSIDASRRIATELLRKSKVDSNASKEIYQHRVEADFTSPDDTMFISKIYYATRTHSQIAQIMKELTKLCSKVRSRLRVTSLGSRKIYCINDDVNISKSLQIINDTCNELISSDSKGGCRFLRNVDVMAMSIQDEIHDMEDIVKVGRQHRICPYFACKKASHTCHLVILPYSIIFNPQLRSVFNIRLNDCILIIDEAHNLCNSLVESRCSIISIFSLIISRSQVKAYMHKYRSRFNALTLKSLKMILVALEQLIIYIRSKYNSEKSDQQHYSQPLVDFMLNSQMMRSDLSSLVHFISEYNLSLKLHSVGNCGQIESDLVTQQWHTAKFFTEKSTDNENTTESLNPFINVTSFLSGLTHVDIDTRVIFTLNDNPKECTVKILDLNIYDHFKEIEKDCHSLIMAGGTMKPIEDFKDHLLGHVQIDKIRFISADHVVSKKNVLALACSGPSQKLDFRFLSRSQHETMLGLSTFLINICPSIPFGFIVFFPCHEYLHQFVDFLKSEKDSWVKLDQRKKIFVESKQNVDIVLANYAAEIETSSTGALLFAVIGGRLSEGINFADNLGRCVCIVGLPYPNMRSIEITEKVRFYNKMKKNMGNRFCEIACWKTINQCIGRIIRHREDYGAIILLDNRYTQIDIVKNNIANWISSQLEVVETSTQCIIKLKKFFIQCKQHQTNTTCHTVSKLFSS
ncbi:hypothetical protein GJ496_001927 [Pomphorhynchus laevis]|nr:hypothetical protein GJ496_001927 [Pomphorhynchus laevis]